MSELDRISVTLTRAEWREIWVGPAAAVGAIRGLWVMLALAIRQAADGPARDLEAMYLQAEAEAAEAKERVKSALDLNQQLDRLNRRAKGYRAAIQALNELVDHLRKEAEKRGYGEPDAPVTWHQTPADWIAMRNGRIYGGIAVDHAIGDGRRLWFARRPDSLLNRSANRYLVVSRPYRWGSWLDQPPPAVLAQWERLDWEIAYEDSIRAATPDEGDDC